MTIHLSGFKSHGIREPLTNRIAGILDEYPDGTQIARELLQNSDDAQSTVQWYLLDHHSYIDNANHGSDLRLFHEDLKEYMGPALLAGSDSLFEERDFKSMKNLAASEKRNDETKIGQMGIGFNSIYHMTDCPSFISGDQLMVIEPHERIFNGVRSEFMEGAVRGSFTEGNQGLDIFPDQLKAFSVLEDIDFSRAYPGTIFRFPLRTANQAETSKLSKNGYPADKVLEMLLKLKNEALKAMLFLKHIEKIAIYERKNLKEGPKKIFEIEIVNAEEVRKERQELLTKLRSHVYPEPTASRDAILEYSIRPIFKLTQDDGTSTLEHWHIATVVGNVLASRDYMEEETEGNLDAHKLIPWVGIAAPSEPGVMIASSGLFCFLPISIQLPFPVHINGHFAVKQSRREIWTNQDNDFAKHASAYIKSVWNVHLFHTHVPLVYAKFLADLGLARGANYDLWPTSCGLGIGLDAIWKDLLTNLVRVICRDNLKVFFCKSNDDDHYLTDYKSLWIADRDIDSYPLLAETLQRLTNVAVGLPDAVIRTIPNVIGSLGLESRILTPALVRKLLREHRSQWSSTASPEARVEMLKYCIEDDDIKDLEGLPLLPLASGLWVEFSIRQARARYLVKQEIFTVLSHSNRGLVDIEFDKPVVRRFYTNKAFHVFWSEIDDSVISARIKDTYDRNFYNVSLKTKDCISQPVDGFPTNKWIRDFWIMVHLRPDQKSLLSMVENLHLLPITRQRLAPLAHDLPVVYLDRRKDNNRSTLTPFLDVLDDHLNCRVMRDDSGDWEGIATDYVFEVSDASKVLGILSEISPEDLVNLGQRQSKISCQYMSQRLSAQTELDEKRLRILKTLPIYQTYDGSTFVSLQYPESDQSKWRVAKEFFHHENPWLPKSIRLLADDQAMLEHLTKLANIPVIRESGYWLEILRHLEEYSDSEWDKIIEKFCEKYHVHCKDYDFASIMVDLPFVRATGPRQGKSGSRPTSQLRLSPRKIVIPSFSPFFADDEIVFPYGVYAKPSILGVLTEIGIRSTFNASFILDRVEELSRYAKANGAQSVRRVLLDFYARLNAAFSDKLYSSKLQDSLRRRSWILADKSLEGKQQCYSSAECRPESEKALLGSQMPLSQFQFTNKSLMECMGWDQPPPLDKVLANFLILIDQANLGSHNGGSKPDEVKFIAIYRYLMEQTKDLRALSTMKETLDSLHWILVDGKLHPTSRVALSMAFNLAPHFVQIKSVGLDDLFIAMGVRRTVGQPDLEGIVLEIGSQYRKDEPLSGSDAELVIELLKRIAAEGAYWSPKLLILTQDNKLRKITEVVYDDLTDKSAISLEEDDDQYTFANGKIGPFVASTLQIPMYSARYWNDQRDSTFEPWAQEEDIVARIGSVLNDYDPSSIFVEFLQNAADAGATKCSFMLDQRSFGKNKVLSKEMAAWQGPALIIYNDAEFTESDFKALSKLGEGNKRGDSSKIGRHGLGFNSVYHFTDVPSVVSGSYIGFFDPHRDYLPKVRTTDGLVGQGGTRSNFLKLRGDTISDQLQPYKDLFGCDMKSYFKGTIFRIPLRTADTHMRSSGKSIISSHWTLSDMHDMLRKWVDDAKVGMLFLDTIKSIEITTISNDPSDERKFMWLAEKSFAEDKPHRDRAICEGNNASTSTQIADIRTTSSVVALRDTQRWLIHTDLEYPGDTPQPMKNLASNNRWYSHRGIAIPISWKSKEGPFNGKLFTHLPTSIVTGIPFHIHGGFALTSNRKSLAGGTDHTSPQYIWNEFMMHHLLPQSAMTALEKLLIYLFWGLIKGSPKFREIDNATVSYFRYWPTKTRPDFESFVKWFSRNTYYRPVYPVHVLNQDVHVRFMAGHDVTFPELHNAPKSMEFMIRGYMRKKDVAISDCPPPIQVRLRNEWKLEPSLNFEAINEDCVRKLIKDEPEFIKKFVKIEDIRWVLEYTLKTILEPKKPPKVPVASLPLLPLMNKTWKPLAPSSACHAAKPEMKELINGGEYLIDESIFRSPVLPTQNGENVTISKLEAIYKRLTSDTIYGVTQLPPAKFATIFNYENPDGVTEEQREKLWRIMEMSKDLEAYGELPILKTLNRGLIPLKYCKNGIEISRLKPQTKRQMEKLSSLMDDLGLIVFDANANKRHPYLIDPEREFTDTMILICISRRCQVWPEGREVTTEEAEVLREMIRSDNDLSSRDAAPLGILRIWPSWDLISNRTSRLIPARGSFFIEGNYNLENLGDNSDVIQSTHCKHFGAMGAKSLNVVTAAESRVMPRLINGNLKCSNNQTKLAYIRMISDILRVVNGKKGPQAKNFLSTGRFILAQDGTFHIGRELFDPTDELCTAVFFGEPSRFPDIQVWQAMGGSGKKQLFGIRDRGSTGVIRECAQYMLRLTSIYSNSQNPLVQTKASALVRHIYQNCEDVDWMSPEWKIVPAEVTQGSPYNEYLPDLPEYLSLSEIVDPSYRDICWTQCAFFPENLKPSNSFKARFQSVGQPKLRNVVNHLSVLADELAKTWVSFDQQPILKMSLFKVYKFLNEFAEKGPSNAALLQRELTTQLHVPYILNGDDKDPSLEDSWLWPGQLMLDIDNDIERHQVVHHKLKSVRRFLVAAGVEQMKTVEGRVEVPEGRRKGDIEARLLNCFESQDKHNGFMDILFQFDNRKQILAHKFMLVHANEYFSTRFTGAWADYTTRDPLNPGVEVIDLSDLDGDETFEAFWGLLYYFYTDNLIHTNGPPVPSPIGTSSSQSNVDILRDRVQYLMELLCLADQYQTKRLKALIAMEVVSGHKVLHSNVFSVRKFAMLYNSKDIKEHCDKYLKMNSSSVGTYLRGELQVYTQSLMELTSDSDGAQRAELALEIKEFEDNLKELDELS